MPSDKTTLLDYKVVLECLKKSNVFEGKDLLELKGEK